MMCASLFGGHWPAITAASTTIAMLSILFIKWITSGISRKNLLFLLLVNLSFGLYMSAVYYSSLYGYDFFSYDHISMLAQLILGPIVFLTSIHTNWRSQRLLRNLSISIILVNVALLISRLDTGPMTGLVLGQIHSNLMGLWGVIGIAYSGLFLSNDHFKKNIFYTLAATSFLVLVLSLSRGAVITLAAFFVFFLMFRHKKVLKFGFFAFVATLTSIISISFFSTQWLQSDYAASVSAYVERVTGKPIDTGRGKFWDLAIIDIMENPITGVGVSARGSWERQLINGREITLSVHNYYLSVLHEAGIIGLAAIIFLLILVFKRFTDGGTLYVRYGISWFLALLVQQTFEVGLTSGSFLSGALIWMLWGALVKMSNSSAGHALSIH